MVKKDKSKSNGRDIQFSLEAADHDDIEALERSKAADARQSKKTK